MGLLDPMVAAEELSSDFEKMGGTSQANGR
jgi:hypothetical protein